MVICFKAKPADIHNTAKGERNHSPCDLVAQRFGGDDGDLLTHPLVDLEVTAQTGVVLLYDDPSGFFNRLCSNAPLSTNHTIIYKLYITSENTAMRTLVS